MNFNFLKNNINVNRKKIAYYLILLSFSYGVFVGHYKYFPFYLLYKIKNAQSVVYQYINSKKYQSSEKLKRPLRDFNNVINVEAIEVDLAKSTGIYLTYGQSNAANHGEIGYEVKNQVYESVFGHEYKYLDPSFGGTGLGGSVWGMVGDKLIGYGIHDKVIFSNCGWSGLKIEQLNDLRFIRCLIMNYHALITKFGRVNGILFHQGESNNSSEDLENYYFEFVDLLSVLKSFGIEIPIYLSRVSYCKEKQINEQLIEIQNNLISDFELIKEGPNTDKIIGKEFRFDHCHFTLKGFDMFSDMWVDILKK